MKVYWTTLYLYLYFSSRARGFWLVKRCLYDIYYIIHTYLSFTIDLSQAPEGKVEVCSNAYQYDAHDRRIRYIPFTLLHAHLRYRHWIRWELARSLKSKISGKTYFSSGFYDQLKIWSDLSKSFSNFQHR